MITFFYAPTPNGWKVAIMLEECGLVYETRLLRTWARVTSSRRSSCRSTRTRRYRRSSTTTRRRPMARRRSACSSRALSCSISPGRPDASRRPTLPGRKELMEWLFWQVGNQGPMAGQLSHFLNYAPEGQEYALKRYTGEYGRNLAVLENRLEGRDYILRGVLHRRHAGLSRGVHRQALGRLACCVPVRRSLARTDQGASRRPPRHRPPQGPAEPRRVDRREQQPALQPDRRAPQKGPDMSAPYILYGGGVTAR